MNSDGNNEDGNNYGFAMHLAVEGTQCLSESLSSKLWHFYQIRVIHMDKSAENTTVSPELLYTTGYGSLCQQ